MPCLEYILGVILLGSEKILDMVDTAAKSKDRLVYKLNLLTRTMKTDDKVLAMVEKIHNILNMRSAVPMEFAEILEEEAEAFMSGLSASASKNGWFVDAMTNYNVRHTDDVKNIMAEGQYGGQSY